MQKSALRLEYKVEAFEQFVALAMETEGLVVSGALKFDVRRRTRKLQYEEWQTHGYEVDLVGARADRLVLATVKSFFGSRGVVSDHVMGLSGNTSWYALLNESEIRAAVLAQAAKRFGYDYEHVEMRLYVGRFAGGGHEARIREWAGSQVMGGYPLRVVGAAEVVQKVRAMAGRTQYRDHPVLASLKVLDSVGMLI
ncbi:hypothetical protein [Microbacterium sp. NPDC089695]|uniref:hypothetical protein n=1 Tax=Microbacterium sp. NPDC089695 TaxID=3364198 RepID=UPI00380E907C